MENTKKKLIFLFIKVFLLFFILVFIIGVYITNAWYAKNRLVNGNEITINSDQSPISLFISNDSSRDYKVSINTDFGQYSGLYPISTSNCQNWYYVSSWTKGYYDNTNGWTQSNSTENALNALANGYTQAQITENNKIGTYTNTAENNSSKVAYLIDTHYLYTNHDNLDIYLNPSNPITIVGQDSKELDKALRIAIKTDNYFLIYSPYDESSGNSGNSIGQINGNTFYAIVNNQLQQISVVTNLSPGTYCVAQSSNDTYVAGNAASLGSCSDSSELEISVYIWLEGTDSQAIVGKSDSDTSNFSIAINYVGIENNS